MTQIIIGNEFGPKIIPLIRQARDSIDVIVYDWRWYPDQIGSQIQKFNNAIMVAKRKGVKIRVITNSTETIDILKKNKIEAKKLLSYRTLHTKNIMIDGKINILGSHNYTMKAFTTNHEVSIVTQNENVIRELTKYFQNLWSY